MQILSNGRGEEEWVSLGFTITEEVPQYNSEHYIFLNVVGLQGPH